MVKIILPYHFRKIKKPPSKQGRKNRVATPIDIPRKKYPLVCAVRGAPRRLIAARSRVDRGIALLPCTQPAFLFARMPPPFPFYAVWKHYSPFFQELQEEMTERNHFFLLAPKKKLRYTIKVIDLQMKGWYSSYENCCCL